MTSISRWLLGGSGAAFLTVITVYPPGISYRPWVYSTVALTTLVGGLLWSPVFKALSIWRRKAPMSVFAFVFLTAGSVCTLIFYLTSVPAGTTPEGQRDAAQGPHLVAANFGVSNAAMAVNNPTKRDQIIAEPISQAWVEIANDPEVIGPAAIARDVRASVIVFDNIDPRRPLFSMEMVWPPAQSESGKEISGFSTGGKSVSFDTGQRRRLTLATKWVNYEDAFGLPDEGRNNWSAPGLKIPTGQYRVVIELRSTTSGVGKDVELVLKHGGKNSPLTLDAARP